MYRTLYALLWYALLPAVILRLLWRSRKQPEYRRHIRERFGFYPQYKTGSTAPVIWMHVVSVGETRAAKPLIDALLAHWPQHRIVLTHMTPTGRATAAELFADNPRVESRFIPYDITPAVKRFLHTVQPEFGIIMETELWPELIACCAQHNIPLLLANARLSERSARGYRKLPGSLIQPMLKTLLISCQTAQDAQRFTRLGATRVVVTGNIKYDITPDNTMTLLAQQFTERLGTRHKILLASTREGEEKLFFQAIAAALPPKDVLLIVVPRHPQRFDDVAQLARSFGFNVQKRSDNTAATADTTLWLGDSMGEMFAYYHLADVAIIGGYWMPLGGHNLIEACIVGTPVIIGPHDFNFSAVAAEALAAGAAQRAKNAEDAWHKALALCHNTQQRQQMREAGMVFTQTHRGATARTIQLCRQMSGKDKDNGAV